MSTIRKHLHSDKATGFASGFSVAMTIYYLQHGMWGPVAFYGAMAVITFLYPFPKRRRES